MFSIYNKKEFINTNSSFLLASLALLALALNLKLDGIGCQIPRKIIIYYYYYFNN